MAIPNTDVLPGQNKVLFYANLYQSYLRRSKEFRWRERRNWDMFSGVNKKQWDPEALQMLIEEKRAPHQINFTQKQVNDLLGTILDNELETTFEPGVGKPSDDTLLLNTLYMSDKDRAKWEKGKRLFKRAGLVTRGSGEMYIDYTNDPQGAIGFRYIPYDRILFDPDWRSDNINDNKHIIQFAWMDPEEIKIVYDKKTPEIENEIKIWKQNVQSRNELEGTVGKHQFYLDHPEFVDIISNRFLVIQVMKLERVPIDRLYDLERNQFLPEMSPENQSAMMKLRGRTLKVIKDKVGVTKVFTCVPGLSFNLELENGNHPVNIGRYPIFTWSYMNIDGEPQGVVDNLSDLNEIYNKRESTHTHWQTTSANGAEFVEENFFANDTIFNKYVNEKNIPGGTYKVRDGTISQGRSGITTRPRDNDPRDLHESADRAFNMVQNVSPVTPQISDASGKSGESAQLNRNKRRNALISTIHMDRGLGDFETEFGEAYFLLAKQLYKGAPRILTNPITKETFMLNVPLSNGEIFNSISQLRRHGVRVTPSVRGHSVREELLDRYETMMPFFQNPILRSKIEKSAFNILPNIPEEERESAMKASDEFIALQESRVQSEIMQNLLGIANAKAQIQQLGGQPGMGVPVTEGPSPAGKTPVEGGGLSVEGKKINPGETIPVDVRTINQLNK